jgi:hypothetical protein
MKRKNDLDAKGMLRAFAELEHHLDQQTRLIVGGGAAMVLAYDHPLATHDVDAFVAKGGASAAELDVAAKKVAATLGIAPDWLNSHFATFTHVLPADYGTRLLAVYRGDTLAVEALGPEDLLLMKCFSARDKDRPHALKLIRIAGNLDLVSEQLSALIDERIPGAERAADYFDDLRDEVDR